MTADLIVLPGSDAAFATAEGAVAATACCSTAAQSTCCEPSEKSSCCGAEATAAGSCGCQ
jgi:hypothetical protein